MNRICFLGAFIGGITGTIAVVGGIVAHYVGLAEGFTAGLTAALVYVTAYYAFLNRRSVEVTEQGIKKRDEMVRYTYLADKWYEIKKEELHNPDFTDPSKTSSYKTSFTGNKLRKYESFAWICWGHAEDVYIYNYHEDPGFEPSLKRCKELHYQWLMEGGNKKHFKPDFIEYIDRL